MTDRTQYVAGLMFSPHGKTVALVRKNRPTWQAGRLNAIGGKVEPGETAIEAMIREFAEETGVIVQAALWKPVAVLTGDVFEVHFFAAFSDVVTRVETTTDEGIELHFTQTALSMRDLIPNLRVIIPLALDDTGIVKPVALTDERPAA